MKKLTPFSMRVNIHFGLFLGALSWAVAFLFLIGFDIVGAISLDESSFKEILLSEEGSLSIVFLFVGALGFIYSFICSVILLFIKNKK